MDKILNFMRSFSNPDVEERDEICYDKDAPYLFVVFGASGDLAKKQVYPKLWYLYRDDLLPVHTRFFAFARSDIGIKEIREECEPFLKVEKSEEDKLIKFWEMHQYVRGSYDQKEDFDKLCAEFAKTERADEANRIFYLAVPPTVFGVVTKNIKEACYSEKGWTRVVVEKPFGKDLRMARELNEHVTKHFKEKEIYRMDHFLGKEIVQNLLVLRFANQFLAPAWNKESIASVFISLREPFGAEGRGGYFDEYGVIRDVMQNHLLQIASLIAMEKPNSLHPNDIRDEKVKVLKCMPELNLKDTILGQYTGDQNGKGDEKQGYREDETVDDESLTSTYALSILRVNNKRWDGVPFLLQCGKALNEHVCEVRIQFKEVANGLFKENVKRNELVLRINPDEAIYIKMMAKRPGVAMEIEEKQLDLLYSTQFKDADIKPAYEKLILDIFCGSQVQFVRSDELLEAWRIFTPLLDDIEKKKVRPIPYTYGSCGPDEAHQKCREANFLYDEIFQCKHDDK